MNKIQFEGRVTEWCDKGPEMWNKAQRVKAYGNFQIWEFAQSTVRAPCVLHSQGEE